MNQPNELEDRLIDFAVRIIKLADALMKSLIDENQQLCRILGASAKTAKQKRAREPHTGYSSMTNDQ